MHCQQNSDFPVFPVFPTESQVLEANDTHYGLGLESGSSPPNGGEELEDESLMASRRRRERQTTRICDRINDE
jgi:hypothetical protein